MVAGPVARGAMSAAGWREGQESRLRHRILLALLILTWAISWPVIKVGVATVPPIWYACFRYVIATSCLFTFVAVRRELALPPRSDWPLVAVSGILQMAAYSALTGLALTILPPGRASVLAFSTPIWVVPLAAWWLHEHASRSALFGVGLGLLGVLAIAAPPSIPREQNRSSPMSCSWRRRRLGNLNRHSSRASFHGKPPLRSPRGRCLSPHAFCFPLAIVVEGAPRPIEYSGAVSLAYVGPIATAFAYWAVVEAGRHIRASTMSMALLATPSLGILISALTLGEAVGASLIAGVVLIGAGIRLATRCVRPLVQAQPALRSSTVTPRCLASANTNETKAELDRV